MILTIRTAVILVLLIDFLQLLAGGREYERFIKLVTGLLVACCLVAGVLQLSGSLSEDTWLLWLEGEVDGIESVVEENAGFITDPEENTKTKSEDNTGLVEIGVPLVEEIPEIVVGEIRVEGEETQP